MDELKLSMICVEWHDAGLFTGTYTKDACKQLKMGLYNSMGYLIAKDNITTMIAGERNDEGEYRAILLIPTGSIVSTKELIVKEA